MLRKAAPPDAAPVCDVFALNEKALARVRKQALTPQRAREIAATYRMLGHPTRMRVLDALAYAELCVCDLAALLNARISAVSHQLALLKAHRLVRSRRDGKMVFYALDDRHVRSLVAQGLAHAAHSPSASKRRAGRRRAKKPGGNR